MRRTPFLATVAAVATLAASCGNDRADVAPTTTRATVAVTTTTPTTTTPTTAPPTTAPPTAAPPTATAPAPGATPAAIIPEVLCWESEPGFAYFGYTNDGSAPVAIPAGAGNRVEGLGDPGDNPHAPTVFAPGRVAPAFAVSVDGGNTPSWTLKGPDGQSRTVTAGPDTPDCTEELTTAANDRRTPALKITYVTSPAGATPIQVAITGTLTGVGPTSVCPTGLDPQPARIWITAGGNASVGTTATVTVPFGPFVSPVSGKPTTAAFEQFALSVVDVCTGAGATTESWPFTPDFDLLQYGFYAFLTLENGQVTLDELPELIPATGGVRIRTDPPT